MQTEIYDTNARKKSANLSINSDLLRQARESHINLLRALEQKLLEILLEEKRRKWKADNREAIEAYNQRIKRDGAFSDGLRGF